MSRHAFAGICVSCRDRLNTGCCNTRDHVLKQRALQRPFYCKQCVGCGKEEI